MTEELGKQLYAVRKMRGLSLQAVAKPSEISAAYLQKLERGEVKGPSPHVLSRLARELDLPYARLMSLAGYEVPGADAQRAADTDVLGFALSSENLSEDESEALAKYLAWYRHDRNQHPGR